MTWNVANSICKSSKTEICCTRFLYLSCCTRNMNGDLINIEKIRYKTILCIFFSKNTELQDKHIGCTVFAKPCPVFVSIKYGQLIFTASYLTLSAKRFKWKASGQVHLLCPWPKHLTGCLDFYMAVRLRGRLEWHVVVVQCN